MSAESDRALPGIPLLDAARCTGCGLCVAACPCSAIRIHEGLPIFSCATACHGGEECPSLTYCLFACEEACPEGAIACEFLLVEEGNAQNDE
jgi:Fe-S-cluster-containing dehydrogenase component